MAMNTQINNRTDSRCRVLLAGVGGGGCTMLSHALEGWDDAPLVAAINTDMHALSECPIELKVLVGQTVAQGLGAGGDAEIGRLAANEDKDTLRALVSNHDLLILVASLGGGTSSGVAPVLGQVAREEGVLTLAYVTMPFSFEGERRQEQAQYGLQALKETVDAVVRLPQENLHMILPAEATLVEAHVAVDRMMSAGIRGLWTLLARNNMINLDFSDLQSLVEHSGNECAFGYAEGTGPEKADQALKELLEGPMTDGGNLLARSGAMLVSVMGGTDLALAELQRISSRLTAAARSDASISIGAAVLKGWEGRLALTLLVAENWIPPFRPANWLSGDSSVGEKPKNEAESASSEPAPAKKRGRKGQKQLELTSAAPSMGQSRFQQVEPSMYEGENLDIPTYFRRGFRIDI